MPKVELDFTLDLEDLVSCDIEVVTVADSLAFPEMGATVCCGCLCCSATCSCSIRICAAAPVES